MADRPQVNTAAASTNSTSAAASHGAPVRWLALALGRFGVTPNGLTYASLVPALAAGIAAAAGAFVVATVCLLLSGLCDLLDGALARATNTATRYGALLDSTLDRLADAAPLLGLMVYFAGSPFGLTVIGIALIGGYTISYIRARAEGLGASLPRLWMRRADRIVLVCVSLLLGTVKVPGIDAPAPLVLVGIGIGAVLSVAASVAALSAARHEFGADRDAS